MSGNKGGGSPKGRVLHSRDVRDPIPMRSGVCAWCGETVLEIDIGPVVGCLRCGSDEVDWIPTTRLPHPPPDLAPTPHRHVADHHTPGCVAYSVLGGTVYGRR